MCNGDIPSGPSLPQDAAAADSTSPPAPQPHQPQYAPEAASWWELIRLFLKLGVVAFGGPVAHIAMMDQEVVEKRQWVKRQHFLDLMAATNLMPGPNSTQMTMHIGYVQKGDAGVFAAGTAFIFPAFLITLAVSWVYVTYRELPAAGALFYGIEPVVVAIIAAALWRLTPKAVTDRFTAGIFVVGLGLALYGINEIAVMAAGGLAALCFYHERIRAWFKRIRAFSLAPLPLMAAALGDVHTVLAATGRTVDTSVEFLTQLGLLFLKFGIILYGSGYLLIVFIQTDLVERLRWLTSAELIQAITIGQLTPGPVLTTSTAVGYILSGFPGAVVATVAIFAPSFFLAMLLGRWMPAIKASEAASAVLKGVTAAVVAVMLAVTIEIGLEVIFDLPTVLLAAAALAALVKWRVSAIVLVVVGGLFGLTWVLLI